MISNTFSLMLSRIRNGRWDPTRFHSSYRRFTSSQWRHNERDGISNHQPQDCLLNGLFRRRWKKTSKLRVTGFVKGIHRWPVNSTHKGPVTRKILPFDDVIIRLFSVCSVYITDLCLVFPFSACCIHIHVQPRACLALCYNAVSFPPLFW